MKRIAYTLTALSLLLVVRFSLPATPQDVSQLQQLFQEWQQANGAIFFPETFRKWQQLLQQPAADSLSVESLRKSLKRLVRLSQKLTRDLQPVLEARQRALEAHAPEFAEDEFQHAEAALHAFTRKVRSGYRYNSRMIAELTRNYQQAFRQAIRSNYLGEALILIQECKDLGANRYFPRRLQRALQLADEVEALVNQPQLDMAQLSAASEELQATVHHLLWLTQHLYTFYRQPGAAERYFTRLENQLDSLALALGSSLSFERDYVETLPGVIQRAQTVSDSLQLLKRRLLRQQQIIDSLRTVTLQLESQQKTRQYIETKLASLKSLTRQLGGQLHATENGVLIRFTNIPYPPGKIEFPPAAVEKINTFLQAILAFPEYHYTIRVRLPLKGNPGYLQNLARQRAAYIRTYLQAQMPLPDSRFTLEGIVEQQLSHPVIEFYFAPPL